MNKILNTKEITKLFNCSQKTLLELSETENFPILKIGNAYVSTVDLISDWIEKKVLNNRKEDKNLKGHVLQHNIVSKVGYDDYFEYSRSERNYDTYAFGEWQQCYAEMFDITFTLNNKKVLDVGCAGGSNAMSFYQKGADIYGCDINEDIINNTPFKELNGRLLAIETDSLKQHFEKETFDFIHSQQVFEHFPSKNYSERVLNAIYELLKYNGFLYVGLVTGEHLTQEELYAEKAQGVNIDITHINVWPREYWLEVFKRCKFHSVEEWLSPIFNCYQTNSGFSYFKEYHWHQFFYSKGNIDCSKFAKEQLKKLLDKQRNYADTNIYNEILETTNVHDDMKAIIQEYI